MSTPAQTAVANLRPFRPGPDPRRNVAGPASVEEREFWSWVREKCFPRARKMLDKMIDQGIDGDEKSALVAFKVMGLIRKQTDEAAIAELAQKLLDGMLEEARARRAANGGG